MNTPHNFPHEGGHSRTVDIAGSLTPLLQMRGTPRLDMSDGWDMVDTPPHPQFVSPTPPALDLGTTSLAVAMAVPKMATLEKSESQNNAVTLCQCPVCPQDNSPATKICHHSDCQDKNDHHPLMLCDDCDASIHSTDDGSGHLRFDLYRNKGATLKHHGSTQSLPDGERSRSDDDKRGSEDDDRDEVDGVVVKRNTKLRRKQALKGRRHHTAEDSVDATKLSVPPASHVRSRSCEGLQYGDQNSSPSQDGGLVANGDVKDFREPWSVDLLPNPGLANETTNNTSSSFGGVEDENEQDKDDSVLTQRNGYKAKYGNIKIRIHGENADNPRYQVNRMSSSPALLHGQTLLSDNDVSPCPSPTPPSMSHGESHSDPNIISQKSEFVETGQQPGRGRPRNDGSGPGGQKRVRIDSATTGGANSNTARRKYSVPTMGFSSGAFTKAGDRKISLGVVECFKIHFDIIEDLTKGADYELVPAIKGVTLRDAVGSFMEKRGLTYDMVDFFIAASQSALQVDTADCYFLAGAELHVRAKQSADPSLTRPATVSSTRTVSQPQRAGDRRLNRPPRDFVPDSSSPHGTLKGTQPLKGIGKLFSSNKKPDQLQQVLHSYQVHGFPPMPELLSLGRRKYSPQVFRLESSWIELVEDFRSANRYQQEAIWELMKTEVAYIRDLELVINLFLSCLLNLQEKELLNDIETEKIFSNIFDIHQANCEFWERHMVQVVEHARESRQPLDPEPLIEGFSEFRSYFEPYSKFCIEYLACQQYLNKMREDNELFRVFLNWIENQKECNRLSLGDYIVKPFHRLTKYKLLLERIWREPRPENVSTMVYKVDQFICRINATVTQLEIMKRIDSYDAVELPNNDALARMASSFCSLDLTRPMPGCGNHTRFLLEEGTLRLNNRTDCICFLFTDIFLVTKATRKTDINNKVKVKIIRPPMRLDKIYVNLLPDGSFGLVYLNEYHLATSAYTFHGDQARIWLDRIKAAQENFRKVQNAALDQSEASLYQTTNGYEEPNDSAFINTRLQSLPPTAGTALETAATYPRTASATSAEGYLGTVFEVPQLDSSLKPKGGHTVESPLNRSTLSLPNAPIVGTSPPQSPHNKQRYSALITGSTLDAIQDSDKDMIPANSRLSPPAATSAKDEDSSSSSTSQPKHISAEGPAGDNNNTIVKLPSEKYTAAQMHMDLKKLKQRRDKRYFTADMIQDLNQGKDSSIQKRLSWHSGNKDTDYEYKQGLFKNKTQSTDSLRSVHSSSGVSSVGSLHFSPDNEICEEGEASEWSEDSGTIRLSTSQNEYAVPELGSPDEDPPPFSLTLGDDDSESSTESLASHKKTVSKSMPDISRLVISDESGVEQIREGQRRKLSQLQNKKLKLLLNSTLEATDV